jgi:hypothetical protein
MIFFNKYIFLGIVLILLGIVLSPVYIGIPLMIIGFLIGDYGIIYSVIKMVPGLNKKIGKFVSMIKKSYQPYFRKRGE